MLSDAAVEAEREWHNTFKELRMTGEWFNLSDTDVALMMSVLGGAS